jgi:hypothetical protein
MTTRINLPDGSVVNVPEGVPLEQAQAEIERYLAQVEPAQRQPQTMEQARPPQEARPQQQRAEAYPDGISPDRQQQAMSIAQALPGFGDRRLPQNVSGQPNPNHQFFQSGGLINDVSEVAKRVPGVVGGAARTAADLANTVVNPYVKYATGYEFPTSASIREGAEGQTQETGQPIARNDTTPQPGATRPATEADQAAATQAPKMPRALSVQGAREQQLGAASQAPLSTGQTIKPGPVPKKAMTNAVRSGMENLMANADKIILARLNVGDIKGATAFRDFIRSEQAQKGMEYMNRTFAAIQYQDNTTFPASAAKMVEAYDPDGDWEVDTERTRLTQDTSGNPSGAILALRNKNTGEVSEQTYQGLAQVYDALARYGDPQGQFTAAQERIQQAQAQKIENAKNFTSAYDAAVEILFPDGFVDGRSMQPFTPEQRQQADTAVREYIASSRPDLPQPPPKQAAAPPPAASGVGSSIRSFFGGSTGDKPVPTFGG